jgi:polysaccharide export outer membrane protein
MWMAKRILSILAFGAFGLSTAAQQKAPPKELVEYVRDAEKAGLKETQIKDNATKAGWLPADIAEALVLVHGAINSGGAASAKSLSAPNTPGEKSRDGGSRVIPPTNTPNNPAPPPAGVPKPAVISRGVPDDYRIGEGDVIQVSVWGEPSASVPSVVVRPDGKITLPLVKDVGVAGLTPGDAEKLIGERLATDIKDADVTVIVTSINSKKIFLVGGVKKEGPIPYTYRMTVMQAISEAGGLTDYAKRKKIYVLRDENGRQYQLPFNYDAVLKGQHMELNYQLQSGDMVVIPQ